MVYNGADVARPLPLPRSTKQKSIPTGLPRFITPLLLPLSTILPFSRYITVWLIGYDNQLSCLESISSPMSWRFVCLKSKTVLFVRFLSFVFVFVCFKEYHMCVWVSYAHFCARCIIYLARLVQFMIISVIPQPPFMYVLHYHLSQLLPGTLFHNTHIFDLNKSSFKNSSSSIEKPLSPER